eukprot:scaffold45186_cov107-Phaeocystis_antarctica.AAC.3
MKKPSCGARCPSPIDWWCLELNPCPMARSVVAHSPARPRLGGVWCAVSVSMLCIGHAWRGQEPLQLRTVDADGDEIKKRGASVAPHAT